MNPLHLLTLATAIGLASGADDDTGSAPFLPTLTPLVPSHPWLTLPASHNYGLFDRPAVTRLAEPEQTAHEGLRVRQQVSSSSTASAVTTGAADGVEDYPTLAAANSDLLASISALDASINAQVSSAMQEMTTGVCVGVPDISGTPVTLCGPTAASAAPGSEVTGAAPGRDLRITRALLIAGVLGVVLA